MTGDWTDHLRLYPEIGQPSWVELIVVRREQLQRELADPARFATPRQLALAHGVDPDAVLYRRDWGSGRLEPLAWDAPLHTGITVLALVGEPHWSLERLQLVLQRRPPILPQRMVWPTGI